MRRVLGLLLLTLPCLSAETKLGKPLGLKAPLAIDQLLAKPGRWVGQVVQIKGKVTEVCQMMGCWMSLVDPASSKAMRIQVGDGQIEFPKDAVGKMALAEGTLTRQELTHEQALARARHEAEEMGRKFDPKSVKGGVTLYMIQGSGAVLLD